jgi:type IV pilus assembly protein PilC
MRSGGVAIARALGRLAENQKPVFKKIIHSVSDDISAGFSFADAIAKHPGAFNNMYIFVSRSGEMTGALDRVLEELATYMENVEAMRAKVKGAMRYPTFILGFVTLMTIGIMWKLVPTFENLYSGMGATLPVPTQILISASNFVQSYLPLIIIGIIALIVLFKVAMTKDGFVLFVDKYILIIPIFGMILKKNIWANFSRTMALLLECGIPILQATEIGAAIVGNKLYANSLRTVHDNLKQGDLLSTSLEKTKLFPVLVTQLVATGEESGKIDQLLRKAADFYEREIRITVDSLASIIEPMLIILLGGGVGGMLIALYLPIFNIGAAIGG